MAARRGARGPRRGARLAPVRAGAGGVRVALADGERSRCARSGTSSSFRPAPRRICRQGSPISSATSSTTSAARAARQLDPLPRGGRPAGDARARGRAVLDLVKDGTAPEEVAVVCPSLERSRASIETAFGSLGVPIAIEARPRLGATRSGRRSSRCSVSRGATARAAISSRSSARRTAGSVGPTGRRLPRRAPRGRAVLRGDRTIEETTKLRNGRPLPILELLARRRARSSGSVPSCERCSETPTVSARRRPRPRRGATSGPRTRRRDSSTSSSGSARRASAIRDDDVLTALDRATVRGDAARAPPAASPLLDLTRARTRTLRRGVRDRPRAGLAAAPGATSPFVDDETRPGLDGASGARLQRPDAASRDRYLFYTACTRRATLLTLVREAATDEGSPREASPFWDAVCGLFAPDDVRRYTTRRPLAQLTWPIESAPTERERLRSLARLAADDPREADALAYANGWQRKLGGARRIRPTHGRSGIREPWPSSRAARRSASPTSSEWPAARPPGSSSGTCGRRGSTRPSTRGCVGSIAHVACNGSTASFRR